MAKIHAKTAKLMISTADSKEFRELDFSNVSIDQHRTCIWDDMETFMPLEKHLNIEGVYAPADASDLVLDNKPAKIKFQKDADHVIELQATLQSKDTIRSSDIVQVSAQYLLNSDPVHRKATLKEKNDFLLRMAEVESVALSYGQITDYCDECKKYHLGDCESAMFSTYCEDCGEYHLGDCYQGYDDDQPEALADTIVEAPLPYSQMTKLNFKEMWADKEEDANE